MSTGGGSQVRRMLVFVDNLADRSGIPFFLETVDVLEQEIVVKRTDLRKIRTTVFIPKEEFYKLKYCSTVVYMVPRA